MLRIIIFASEFPERKANLQERTERILRDIKKSNSIGKNLLEKNKCFLYVRLSAGAFKMF